MALFPPGIAQSQYTQSDGHNDYSVLPIGFKCYRERGGEGEKGIGEERGGEQREG